jgi:hypothetical protein
LHVHQDPSKCFWVSVNRNKQVTEINLGAADLKGEIPAVFHVFPMLKEVRFGGNTGITGSIPDFSCCKSLETIYLRGCSLVGNMPNSWPSKLQQLNLEENRMLCGPVCDFSKYGNLESIELCHCNLEGNLPQAWPTKLKKFNISHNEHLSGTIPSFRKCDQLEMADFSNCNFTGKVPQDWPRTLKNLKVQGNVELQGEVTEQMSKSISNHGTGICSQSK